MSKCRLWQEYCDCSAKRQKRRCFLVECCALGALIAGVALAIIIAIWLSPMDKSKDIALGETTMMETTMTTTFMTTTLPICSYSCLNQTCPLASDLLAKWNFDGTFADDTNTYPTIPVNNPTFITSGYVRRAVFFNCSANQYLYTSYIPLIKASFTVEAWIYPISQINQTDMSILGLCTYPGNDECLHLTLHNLNSSYHLNMAFFGDGCFGIHSVPMNQWNHVAFTFDNSTHTMTIYLNGEITGRAVSVFPLLGTPQNVTIGYIPKIVAAYGENFFHGYMDHMTISNRSKAACEIFNSASLSVHHNFDSNIQWNDTGPNTLETTSRLISSVVSSRSGNAISFSTPNSSLQIKGVTHLSFTNRPFSISLWIRPSARLGTLVLISEPSSNFGWCMPLIGFGTNGSIVAQSWSGSIRAIFGPVLTTSIIWYHIVQTWSPANGLRLYLDHNLVASDLLATNFLRSSTATSVILGSNSNSLCLWGAVNGSVSYSGEIDDFRIYNRELSANDVCTLYVH